MLFEVLTHIPYEREVGEPEEVEWGTIVFALRIKDGVVVVPQIKYGIHRGGEIHLNVRRIPDSELHPDYEVTALIGRDKAREILSDVTEHIIIKHQWASDGNIDANVVTMDVTFGDVYGRATCPYFIRRDNTVIFQRQLDFFPPYSYRLRFEMTITERQKMACFDLARRYLEETHPWSKCAI